MSMERVSMDYEAGKWVPSYYGLKFTVAKKGANIPCEQNGIRFVSECDPTIKVRTLAEAQEVCDGRNSQFKK
jgi:hypothetical protein